MAFRDSCVSPTLATYLTFFFEQIEVDRRSSSGKIVADSDKQRTPDSTTPPPGTGRAVAQLAGQSRICFGLALLPDPWENSKESIKSENPGFASKSSLISGFAFNFERRCFVKVFRPKSRLVSFRVSEQEYQSLQRTAAVHGVRGISDVARFAMRKVLAVPLEEQKRLPDVDWLAEESVNKLTQNLEQLSVRMDQIVQRLDVLTDADRYHEVSPDAEPGGLKVSRAMSASGISK